VTVVDIWVNALTDKSAKAFTCETGNEGIVDLLGGELSSSNTLDKLLATMDACGVDASDHPFLPMERAVAAAGDLPLSAEALDACMGGTALQLLRRP
jgi:hypothetical protein